MNDTSKDGRYICVQGFVAGEGKAQQVYVRKEVKRLLTELLLIEEDSS